MKYIGHNRIRRTREGAFVLRYSVWYTRGKVAVSVYALTGDRTPRWELGHREWLDAPSPNQYTLGENLVKLWAMFNEIGDYQIFENAAPPRSFHPSKLGEDHEL